MIMISPVAQAKSGGGGSGGGGGSPGGTFKFTGAGKGDGLIWFGLGSGALKPTYPKTGYNPSGSLCAYGGIEGTFGKSPFGILLGIFGSATSGKVDYDYTSTGATPTHYTATGVDFTSTLSGLDVGLLLRIINAGSMHFFIQAGGTLLSEDIWYDTSNTNLAAQGSTFQTKQSAVMSSGYFGVAGIDFIIGDMGIRLAGRGSLMSSDKIDALAGQRIKSANMYGFAAIVKQY